MKIITLFSLHLFLILIDAHGFYQETDKKEIDFNVIRREIEWFIETVKPESYKQGIHNVYVARLFEGEKDGEYCFSITYIVDQLLFNEMKKFKYFFLLKEDLIIIDYSREFNEKFFISNGDNIKVLNDSMIVANMIDNEGEHIGTCPGYVCCYEEGIIRKTYYENSDEMPADKAVFHYEY